MTGEIINMPLHIFKPKLDFTSSALSIETQAGLTRYIVDHIEPGGYLRAVLENDLMTAIQTADSTHLKQLKSLCNWIFNHAPGNSWGDRCTVDDWIYGELL